MKQGIGTHTHTRADLLTVDTLEDARKKLLECARLMGVPKMQTVPGVRSFGRIAGEITAPCDIPAFARSSVDGYALCSRDTAAASETMPVFLTVAGSVLPGCGASFSLNSGLCAYVATGAMIPPGADSVVMIEYTERFGEQRVAVCEPCAPGDHVVLAGDDVRAGQVLIPRGARIRPEEAGALAAAGVTRVPVFERIKVAVISTGDELVFPRERAGDGQVRDINSYSLCALARQSGFAVNGFSLLPDDESLLEQTVSEAMHTCGIVTVSGGSSKGEKDCTADVIARVADSGVIVHGLALKPGKPAILGFDSKTGTILAGLPGHPVSAMIVFRLLFVWLWKTITGQKADFPVPAKLSCNIAASPGMTTVQPVSLHPGDGGYTACPVFGKSGLITSLTKADGYIVIERNKEGLNKDEAVLVYLL
jgi:molybdopterin molybdotransferase